MSEIHALAAMHAKGKFEPFHYTPGRLSPEQVEIAVEYCGICHSDLSMLNNEWGMTKYPLVPGHEAIGKITEVGEEAKFLKVGQTVGLGWNSGSCLHCRPLSCGRPKHVSDLGIHNRRTQWRFRHARALPLGLGHAHSGRY